MNRISLDNEEFEGNNNAYVLDGGDQVCLIDTGIATSTTKEDLANGLAKLGYSFKEIDTIAVTHWHPDHAGLAGEIQRASGATVFAHEADAPLVAGDSDELEAYARLQRTRFEEWGIPDDKLTEILQFLDSWNDVRGPPAEVTTVTDGDRIDLGTGTLTVAHAPGHTAGSVLFQIEDQSSAFVGDVLLPVYTPNIGGADLRVEQPLATYLDTLTALATGDIDRALPGHRTPIEQPRARASEIIEHHHLRTNRVLNVLRENGPADPWSVSAELFGELSAVHIMHGPGEAFAHLDHLQHHGVIEVEDGEYGPPPPDIEATDVLTQIPAPK